MTRSTIRNWLDIVASTVMIGAAVVVIIRGTSRQVDIGVGPPPLEIPKEVISFENAATQGSLEAPLVMLEMTDAQCPFCGKFARDIFPEIDKTYIEAGTVQFAVRHFPLAFHSFSKAAAQAAECARQQDKFWPVFEGMFDRARLDEKAVRDIAGSAGVDLGRFDTCRSSKATSDTVSADQALGTKLGVKGTPTFFIGLREGKFGVRVKKVMAGITKTEAFQRAFDEVLKEQKTR